MLSTTDHNQNLAGLQYVYAVVSRRAGGVSVGLNLNPNNACNWRCLYCQVPDLQRGNPPALDLTRLAEELRQVLADILHGDFLAREAPPTMRRLVDVAFSGNGEPTLAPEFPAVVAAVVTTMATLGLDRAVRRVLITNGSQIRRPGVQDGLRQWASAGGEAWFKFDRATAAGRSQVNDIALSDASVWANLETCVQLIPTWLQTCWFTLDGQAPSSREQAAYLDSLRRMQTAGWPLQGVQLYGLARPSFQPEAPRLGRLSAEEMEAWAGQIRALGVKVAVFP